MNSHQLSNIITKATGIKCRLAEGANDAKQAYEKTREVMAGHTQVREWSADKGRIDSRVQDVIDFLEPTKMPAPGGNLLDIGCASGDITEALAARLELIPYGVDVLPSNGNDKIVYIQAEQGKPYDLNVKFDLITCFVSIHHIVDLDLFLDELDRLSDAGTILFVREHDTAPNTPTAAYINCVHAIYAAANGNSLDDALDEVNGIRYMTRPKLTNVLSARGWVRQKNIPQSVKLGGPQKLYVDVFVKK